VFKSNPSKDGRQEVLVVENKNYLILPIKTRKILILILFLPEKRR
jgi:hypothetical protein